MKSLFFLKQLNYTKVKHPSLPARPTGSSDRVYIGKGFKGKPDNLDNYVKGGYRYSEKRKQEILSKREGQSIFRTIAGNLFGTARPVVLINSI